MAISRMQKVQIFVHASEKDDLVERVQTLGLVHLTDFAENYADTEYSQFASTGRNDLQDLEQKLSDLRFADEYLAGFDEKGGFRATGGTIAITEDELRGILKDFDEQEVVNRCREMDRRRSQIAAENNKLRSLRYQLEPWFSLDVPIADIKPTAKTIVSIGTVPRGHSDTLIQELNKNSDRYHLEMVDSGPAEESIFLIYLREDEEYVGDALKKVEFSPVAFPLLRDIPYGEGKKLEKQIADNLREDEEITQKSRELSPQRRKLLILIDHYADLLEKKAVDEKFAQTSRSLMLDGWIRRDKYKLLKEEIEGGFRTASVAAPHPLPKETPPVELDNRQFTLPFEVVTDLYGRPRYTEIDPTPFLAPFFAIFFAICLTDGGYGFMLTAFSILALKKLSLGPGTRRLMKLLLYSGLFTIGTGILTGSYFGVSVYRLESDNALVELAQGLMLFDPLDQVMLFFAIALGCGVIHLVVSFGLKLYTDLKMGGRVVAVLNRLPWMFATVGLGLFMIAFVYPIPQAMASAGTKILLAGMVGILLFNGLGSGSITKWLGGGLGGLYGITGIFGDLLSYLRLLALGLATAVVAGVIDILAGLIASIPILGVVLAAIVLIIGHVVYLAISCLGAFVHTARLTFVEFFSKFYEGGGEPFEPFRRRLRYILVNPSEKG